jgi:hypothetical protein
VSIARWVVAEKFSLTKCCRCQQQGNVGGENPEVAAHKVWQGRPRCGCSQSVAVTEHGKGGQQHPLGQGWERNRRCEAVHQVTHSCPIGWACPTACHLYPVPKPGRYQDQFHHQHQSTNLVDASIVTHTYPNVCALPHIYCTKVVKIAGEWRIVAKDVCAPRLGGLGCDLCTTQSLTTESIQIGPIVAPSTPLCHCHLQ